MEGSTLWLILLRHSPWEATVLDFLILAMTKLLPETPGVKQSLTLNWKGSL